MTTMTNPSVTPLRQRSGADSLFVVATHKVRDPILAGPGHWVPYGTEHAWRPGTRRTLCGEYTSGWTVFWERQFSARLSSSCSACVEMTLPEASRRRLDPIRGREAS